MFNKVEKALTPEEETILSNIESLVVQLKQMNAGEAAEIIEEPEEIAMSKQEEEEDEKMEKSIETTPSEAATASDDAEERIDETQTEQAEEAVQEVVKALLQAVNKSKKPVKKSANALLIDAIKELTEVQKSSQERVGMLETAFNNILEANGIVKQFELAKKSESSQKVAKTQDAKNQEFMNQLKDFFNLESKVEKGKETHSFIGQNEKVQKNIQSALPQIFKAK